MAKLTSKKPFKIVVTTGVMRTPYDKPEHKARHGPYYRRAANAELAKKSLIAEVRSELERGTRVIIEAVATSLAEDVFNREMVKLGQATMLPGMDLLTGGGDKPKPVVQFKKRSDQDE